MENSAGTPFDVLKCMHIKCSRGALNVNCSFNLTVDVPIRNKQLRRSKPFFLSWFRSRCVPRSRKLIVSYFIHFRTRSALPKRSGKKNCDAAEREKEWRKRQKGPRWLSLVIGDKFSLIFSARARCRDTGEGDSRDVFMPFLFFAVFRGSFRRGALFFRLLSVHFYASWKNVDVDDSVRFPAELPISRGQKLETNLSSFSQL